MFHFQIQHTQPHRTDQHQWYIHVGQINISGTYIQDRSTSVVHTRRTDQHQRYIHIGIAQTVGKHEPVWCSNAPHDQWQQHQLFTVRSGMNINIEPMHSSLWNLWKHLSVLNTPNWLCNGLTHPCYATHPLIQTVTSHTLIYFAIAWHGPDILSPPPPLLL